MFEDLVKSQGRIVQLIGGEWGVRIGKHVPQQQTAAGRWPLWPICSAASSKPRVVPLYAQPQLTAFVGRNEQMCADLVK